ncbi:MAG: hypothetical protein LBU47_07060 [Christensenellaceae bacterium]|jgi:hypothetical protein|nr:hypothetical protein [Christensenellaceae bacterium]
MDVVLRPLAEFLQGLLAPFMPSGLPAQLDFLFFAAQAALIIGCVFLLLALLTLLINVLRVRRKAALYR